MCPEFCSRTAESCSTLSSLYVLFFLFILLSPDFASSVSPIQHLLCCFGTPSPEGVSGTSGKRPTHHAPHASPHYEKTQGKHDDHGYWNYPPPPKSATKALVSPHLNPFLSRSVTHIPYRKLLVNALIDALASTIDDIACPIRGEMIL